MKKKKINIIYIAPAHKNASGGSKVIYQHSELINKFKIDNMSSYVLHLKKTKILLFADLAKSNNNQRKY